jgi:HEAT repeat protein
MGRSLFSVLIVAVVVSVAGAVIPAGAQSSYQDELANLRSPNVKTRVNAAKALGRSGRREAIEPLTEAVRDPEAKVRKAVVQALRKFRDVEAVDGLLMGLTDEEKDIRSESMAGILDLYVAPEKRGPILGVFKTRKKPEETEPVSPADARVIGALEARLRDEEPSIRRQAAYVLGMLQSEESVDALVLALPDMSLDVRAEVVDALGRIGGDQAGQSLIRALADSSSRTRSRAIDALGRMRYNPAAPALLNIYEAEEGKSMGDRALAALAQMGAPEARGVFYQMMTSSKPQRRTWAVEGLARLDEPRLAPSLTKDFLREPDPKVQLAYCFALARLGRPEFIDRLALSLSKPDLRDQSRVYLVELGTPLLTELVTYLADPVVEVRKNMVLVLMEIGDPAAIPYLEPLLSDPDPEVADRANRAIAKLQRVQMTASATPTR